MIIMVRIAYLKTKYINKKNLNERKIDIQTKDYVSIYNLIMI